MSDKPIYEAQSIVPQSKIDYVNQLLDLTGPEIYDRFGLKRDENISFPTITFSNGYELDVVVVICEEETPYIDLVLFDAHGQECFCDVLDGSLTDPIDLELDDVHYIAQIKGIDREAERVQDEAVVYMVSPGGVKHQVISGTYEECNAFCEKQNWEYADENCFVWTLELEDLRELDRDSPSLAEKIRDASKQQSAQAAPSTEQAKPLQNSR